MHDQGIHRFASNRIEFDRALPIAATAHPSRVRPVPNWCAPTKAGEPRVPRARTARLDGWTENVSGWLDRFVVVGLRFGLVQRCAGITPRAIRKWNCEIEDKETEA